MQTTFNLTSALEKSFGAAAAAYKIELTRWLASEYGFDANDALEKIGESEITRISAKKPKKAKTEEKQPKAQCPLPYRALGECYCQALRLDHGLYTQCSNKHLESGSYCKTCQKQVDTKGSAPYGTVSDRSERGTYIDPSGKKEKTYGTVLKQCGIDVELARSEVAKYGIEVAEEEWEVKVGKRGRPKGVAVSDTESSGASKEVKKRGRPKKPVETGAGEDLISALARQAMETSDDSEGNDQEMVFDEGVIEPNDIKLDEVEATPVSTELTEEVAVDSPKAETPKGAMEEEWLSVVGSQAAETANEDKPEEKKPKQRKKRIGGINYVITPDNQVYYGKDHEHAGTHCGEWNEESKSITFIEDDDEESTEEDESSEI